MSMLSASYKFSDKLKDDSSDTVSNKEKDKCSSNGSVSGSEMAEEEKKSEG
jgi:hypothetical protein